MRKICVPGKIDLLRIVNTTNAAKCRRAPTKNCHRYDRLWKIFGPGNVGQSSPNSGSKCRLARPITMLNFTALGHRMYEKSVTKYFYTLQYFAAPGGPPGSQFINLGAEGSLYQLAKFRPPVTTCLRDISCRTSLISLKA